MQRRLVVAIGLAVLVSAGSPAPADVMDAARCKEAKAKETGKKVASLLKAFGKNEKRPNLIKLALDISKAGSKFTKGFTKAESIGCQTTGDADVIGAKVDAFVLNVAGMISPVCGDAIVAPDEECDDGNSLNGDCCSSECMSTEEGPCCMSGESACCVLGPDLLSFETSVGSGKCGELRNYRCGNPGTCSDDPGRPCLLDDECPGPATCEGEGDPSFESHGCVDDGDCDLGPCDVPETTCQGDAAIACTQDSDCTAICVERTAGQFPVNLDCGAVYVGGGLNSVPLPIAIPDRDKFFVRVTSCNGVTGEMTLGPTTPTEVGTRHCTQGRQCSSDGSPCVLDGDCGAGTCEDLCLFGAPLPMPNAAMPIASTCVVKVVAEDATGTAQCTGGAINLTIPRRAFVYLTGDLFGASAPPDIPGVQPCPLCDYLCQGGSKDKFPCDDDSECPGGSCGSSTECLGGADDGSPCTPATSDETVLGDGYPVSHDCRPLGEDDITSEIGGLPIAFAPTTGTDEWNAVNHANGLRVFCGFCRDVTGWGTGCFEGDKSGGCPVAIPPADGNAVSCTSDADCQADADEYESCVQRNPGAFSKAASTRISVTGSTDGGCLADGQPHAADLVNIFCMPPTFAPVINIDAVMDLPGPAAAMMQGEVILQ